MQYRPVAQIRIRSQSLLKMMNRLSYFISAFEPHPAHADDMMALSIADIEKQLDERHSHVLVLMAQREKLKEEIDQLDIEIRDLGLLDGHTRRRRRRPKNATPLRPVLLSILKKNRKGLSLNDLAEKILETGYKSTSRKFSNVVYQCLYVTADIDYDSATGLYSLEK